MDLSARARERNQFFENVRIYYLDLRRNAITIKYIHLPFFLLLVLLIYFQDVLWTQKVYIYTFLYKSDCTHPVHPLNVNSISV